MKEEYCKTVTESTAEITAETTAESIAAYLSIESQPLLLVTQK